MTRRGGLRAVGWVVRWAIAVGAVAILGAACTSPDGDGGLGSTPDPTVFADPTTTDIEPDDADRDADRTDPTAPSTTGGGGVTATAAPTPEPTNVAGTYWESVGFGLVVAFGEDGRFELHEVTPPLGSIRVLGGAWNEVDDGTVWVSREENDLFDRGDVLGTVRTGPGRIAVQRVGTLDEVTFLPLAGRPDILDRPPATEPPAVAAYFCRTFEAHHAFLSERIDQLAAPTGVLEAGTSWGSYCGGRAAALDGDASDDELCGVMSDVLLPLGDTHTWLYDPDDDDCDDEGTHPDTFTTLGRGDTDDAFDLVDDEYLDGGVREGARGEIEFGRLVGAPAMYVRIWSFSDFARGDDPDADRRALADVLDTVAERYARAGLRGVVIDLRDNGGGRDDLGLDIAARFTADPYVAHQEIARADPDDPATYTDPEVHRVVPSRDPTMHDATVVLLTGRLSISAAETFALAMLDRPATSGRVVRIGEPTQGVFSDVIERVLPNGWVVGLPNERYLTNGGEHFEVAGIPPDIAVPVFAPDDIAAGRDPALDAAIDLLNR